MNIILMIGGVLLVTMALAKLGMESWEDGLRTYHKRVVSGDMDIHEQMARMERRQHEWEQRQIEAAEAAEAAAVRRQIGGYFLLLLMAGAAVGGQLWLRQQRAERVARTSAQPAEVPAPVAQIPEPDDPEDT